MSLKIDSPELNDLKLIYIEFMKYPAAGLTFGEIEFKTKLHRLKVQFWIDKLQQMSIIEPALNDDVASEAKSYRVKSEHLREYLRSIE